MALSVVANCPPICAPARESASRRERPLTLCCPSCHGSWRAPGRAVAHLPERRFGCRSKIFSCVVNGGRVRPPELTSCGVPRAPTAKAGRSVSEQRRGACEGETPFRRPQGPSSFSPGLMIPPRRTCGWWMNAVRDSVAATAPPPTPHLPGMAQPTSCRPGPRRRAIFSDLRRVNDGRRLVRAARAINRSPEWRAQINTGVLLGHDEQVSTCSGGRSGIGENHAGARCQRAQDDAPGSERPSKCVSRFSSRACPPYKPNERDGAAR